MLTRLWKENKYVIMHQLFLKIIHYVKNHQTQLPYRIICIFSVLWKKYTMFCMISHTLANGPTKSTNATKKKRFLFLRGRRRQSFANAVLDSLVLILFVDFSTMPY